MEDGASFPAPLVLPSDDLSLDPRYPPQSLRSWIREKDRNKVTDERRTIYVAAPPEVTNDVGFLREWSHSRKKVHPKPSRMSKTEGVHENIDISGVSIQTPSIEDVKEYLAAFYHGLPVKRLPSSDISFTTWDNNKSKSSKVKVRPIVPPFIGFKAFLSCTRIRIRPTTDSVFPGQLNLDDLLDAAISMLPDDAYALLLLVNHDLFEDEDDEFVCGRAYGGSRVAVISTARYHPELDDLQNVEQEHAWPASHCDLYMKSCCSKRAGLPAGARKKGKTQSSETDQHSSLPSSWRKSANQSKVAPIQAAVSTHSAFTSPSVVSNSSLSKLWLSRVCRTASHELGHCFGMDHCVYYACSMQGSGSLAEDARQPPYLCPVDLAKLLDATGTEAIQRYRALFDFCQKHGDGQLFTAFAAWLRARLVDLCP